MQQQLWRSRAEECFTIVITNATIHAEMGAQIKAREAVSKLELWASTHVLIFGISQDRNPGIPLTPWNWPSTVMVWFEDWNRQKQTSFAPWIPDFTLWIPDTRYWIPYSTTVDSGFRKGWTPVCSFLVKCSSSHFVSRNDFTRRILLNYQTL